MKGLVVIGAVLFVAAGICHAAQSVGPVTITRLRTGWNGDAFAIETNQAISNPANCEIPDGYGSESSSPGYKTYYAAALTALGLGKPITIIVSDVDCSFERPKIWGIYIEN